MRYAPGQLPGRGRFRARTVASALTCTTALALWACAADTSGSLAPATTSLSRHRVTTTSSPSAKPSPGSTGSATPTSSSTPSGNTSSGQFSGGVDTQGGTPTPGATDAQFPPPATPTPVPKASSCGILSLQITPGNVYVAPPGTVAATLSLSAVVTLSGGATSSSVVWLVSPDATISTSGLLTIPAGTAAGSTFTVTAQSPNSACFAGSAVVQVQTPAPASSASPSSGPGLLSSLDLAVS